MLEILLPLVVFILLIVVGGGIGASRERRHLAELDEAEARQSSVAVTDTRTLPGLDAEADFGVLVMGATVISTDYLKSFLANLRNLFGGEVRSYQTLLSRARREAKRRMIDDAARVGAAAVVNVRFETSMIGNESRNNATTSIEVLCYGTAVVKQG